MLGRDIKAVLDRAETEHHLSLLRPVDLGAGVAAVGVAGDADAVIEVEVEGEADQPLGVVAVALAGRRGDHQLLPGAQPARIVHPAQRLHRGGGLALFDAGAVQNVHQRIAALHGHLLDRPPRSRQRGLGEARLLGDLGIARETVDPRRETGRRETGRRETGRRETGRRGHDGRWRRHGLRGRGGRQLYRGRRLHGGRLGFRLGARVAEKPVRGEIAVLRGQDFRRRIRLLAEPGGEDSGAEPDAERAEDHHKRDAPAARRIQQSAIMHATYPTRRFVLDCSAPSVSTAALRQCFLS